MNSDEKLIKQIKKDYGKNYNGILKSYQSCIIVRLKNPDRIIAVARGYYENT